MLGSEFKTLDHVKIVSLPDADKGTLSLDGVAITSTSWENPVEVTKVQLDEDKLTYRPPLDANGDGLAVFYFRVNDGADDSLFSDTMTIDVTAVNDPPSVSGPAAIEYPDDGTVAVATYTATDPDGDAITWSLSGADSSAFNISAPGVLSFSSAPDFEDPADANDNNVYEVTVEASDGGSTNGTRDVTVTVTKTAVSGLTAIEYEENGVAAVATYTVAGSVGTITWSLSGADSSAFSISNGVLSFSSSPDYEAPADANGNNVYVVTVEASDGGSTVGTRDVTVRVTNGNDAPATMDDTATTNASRAVVVRVLDNDVDVDGDILTVTVPQLGQPGRPTYGTVVPSDGATTITYRLRDANASHIGDDTFTYTVSDGTATATGMVTVTENADLATLSISDVTLNEPFTPCLHLLFSWPRTNEAQTPAHRSPG